jgi:hypothetical protein
LEGSRPVSAILVNVTSPKISLKVVVSVDCPIYVEFGSELKDQLGEDAQLESVLEAEGLQVQITWGAVPPTSPNERTKNLVEIVTAGSIATVSLAASVKILMSAISSYLDRKAVRDSHFVVWLNEPIRDAEGKPLLDDDGRPLLVRRRLSGFDALPATAPEGMTLTVGTDGVSVQITEGQTQG